MERARENRKRRLVVATTGLLSAAAAVVLFFGIDSSLQDPTDAEASGLQLSPRGPHVAMTRGGDSQPLSAPIALAARGELTVSAPSELKTSRGLQIALDSDTRVGLDGMSPARVKSQLRLAQGKVRCAVPPLKGDESFSVVTNQAEVVVHGTEFTVEMLSGNTCVRVSQGLVEVRHATGSAFLSPGASWGCDVAVAESEETVTADPIIDQREVEADRPSRSKIRARTPRPSDEEPSGTLAEETRLFSAALAAERRGDESRASALYSRLLQRYPGSPLAPEARRGLARVK
jgi:TolA-binding protein